MDEVTDAVVEKSQSDGRKRTGRPAKVVDLKAVFVRLKRGESLRSVARSLGMSHSTLAEHIKRSGLVEGFDW
jgi:transposase-like protein